MWRPSYVSGAELRAYVRSTVAADLSLFVGWADAASRAVDASCHRQFGWAETAETRTYVPRWARSIARWALPIDDLQGADVADLTVLDPTGATVTGSTLLPVDAPNEGLPYTRLALPVGAYVAGPLDAWQVTAPRWGWTATPGRVVTATYLQGARLAWRRQAPAGIAGSPDSGSEVRLLAKLDADVAVTLRGLARRPDLS